jgi:hypothetical protein
MTTAEKEQLDIQLLYRGVNLWQFRFGEGSEHYHTKSFSDSGRHSDESLEEARNYRNEFFKAHPEFLELRAPFRTQLPSNNSTGILGVNYTERTLPSGNKAPGWQMTCPSAESDEPVTARFSVRKYGETQALLKAVQARREATIELLQAEKLPTAAKPLQHLIDEYDDIISELKESIDREDESELLSIIKEARMDGRIFPVSSSAAPRKQQEGELGLKERWYPIQVKQKDKAGRPDIDAFEAMMMREDCEKGFFVSFDYSSDALSEIESFFKRSHKVIVALTVQEIFDEMVVRAA